jgi:hypothetical protein
MPRREPLRRWWPRVLPVAVLACFADLAVGLRWLVPVVPGARPTLRLLGALVVIGRAVAVGIAIALLLVLDRRAGLAARVVRAGVAGGAPLAVAWGNMVETGLARLAGLLLPSALLARAILSAPLGLALFAGTAPVALAAAQAPAVPPQQGRNPSSARLPRAPTRSHRI